MIFVNSMSDLFHEDVPLAYIRRVFDVMHKTPQHTYQVLTKRSKRLVEFADALEWTPNIWMGVSVENERCTFRIGDLIKTPAHTRFVSLEPLLGPVRSLHLRDLDWVIVGGESGPGARPLKKEWVESIRERCNKHGVPFFFKQWGRVEFNDDPRDATIASEHPEHAKGGCQLNGRVYREMPRACLTTGSS